MKKVLIVVGPTGVGKTKLSIDLARRFNGEIISGDSIQVYKGLDVGSAKITEEEKNGIVHYGIDTLESIDSYNVASFQSMARKYIDVISDKDKLPMIVGGTGLYIKACIYDYSFVEFDDRGMYEEYDKNSNEELYEELLRVDKEACEKIHINNRRRVIRALVLNEFGESKSSMENRQNKKLIYDAFIVGCTMPREILYERINQRVKQMIDKGLEKEIKGLLDNGLSFNNLSMQGIGYKEWKDYFEGEISLDEVVKLIQKNSRNLAKKQYTWFNNQMDIHWVNMLEEKEVTDIYTRIEKWIKD